jgi:Mce-associated membrane protein
MLSVLDHLPDGDSPAAAEPHRPRRLIAVLSALVVALVAASVVLVLVVRSNEGSRDALVSARQPLQAQQAVTQRRDDALEAAKRAILDLDALSAATIDKDIARVVVSATGTFKTQFAKAQADLRSLVVSRKTVSKGTILSAGVVRADQDTATVLVAVDRFVTDTTNVKGVTARDRWKVSLELHGGRWLVANLEAVA